MQSHQIHLFSDGHTHVAYNAETMCFYRLTDEHWEEAQSSGTVDGLPLGRTELPQKYQESTVEPKLGSQSTCGEERIFLQRLVLVSTTHCNLRCSYCYAEGGTYGMIRQHMNEELVCRALNWAMDHFSGIDMIMFFGGEPALNHKVIRIVCEAFDQAHASKRISWLPRYAMVTNGTHLPVELEELVHRYCFEVTFSIDGPAQVHNVNRFYAGGKGSFETAFANLKRLRTNSDGVNLGVEITFTPSALDAGYGVWELARFSRNVLGLSGAHIVPVATKPGSAIGWDGREKEVIASYRAAMDASLQSLLEGQYVKFSYLPRILQALITKKDLTAICPAGLDTLAIDPEGDIYPCFMFAGQPELRLGNVNTPFAHSVFLDQLRTFQPYVRKDARPACRTCWARKLCCICCLGNDLLVTGALDQESLLNCNIMKATAEETMLFLARIQGDAETWKRFVANYRALRIGEENS